MDADKKILTYKAPIFGRECIIIRKKFRTYVVA
jgi:hypothetical protein